MDVNTLGHGLEFVEQLKPVSFYFKKDRDTEEKHGRKKYGFLAQDIISLEGDDVVIADNTNEDKYAVTSDHLIPVLVNAIQELSARVKELESR